MANFWVNAGIFEKPLSSIIMPTYYGKPWIWNMLHNFGGNITLWGRMDNPAKDPAAALQDENSGKMTGIGLTPEAIEQNPVLYHLMLENVWRDSAIDLHAWLKDYALQRYGVANTNINQAWTILSNSVYQGGLTEGGPESIITARPTLDSSAKWARTKLDYDPRQLLKAWDLFVKETPSLGRSDGFRYDLVDITRQALANYANRLQQQFAAAFLKGDEPAFLASSNQFITLLDDMDALLSTRSDFLLGKWIQQARNHGITSEEKNQYEQNARNQITLWGDQNSPLHDYSCRQWAGLIKGFYQPRWQTFIAQLRKNIKDGTQPDFKQLEQQLKAQEWKWVNSHKSYPDTTSGSEIKMATMLYNKYRPQMEQSL